MSGILTTLFFKEDFGKNELENILEYYGDYSYTSDNSCDLVCKEIIKDAFGEFEQSIDLEFVFSNNFDQNLFYHYNEDVFQSMINKAGEYCFILNIDVSTNGEAEKLLLLRILERFKETSYFFFSNSHPEKKIIKHFHASDSVKAIKEEDGVYLFSSSIIDFIIENKFLNIGWN